MRYLKLSKGAVHLRKQETRLDAAGEETSVARVGHAITQNLTHDDPVFIHKETLVALQRQTHSLGLGPQNIREKG